MLRPVPDDGFIGRLRGHHRAHCLVRRLSHLSLPRLIGAAPFTNGLCRSTQERQFGRTIRGTGIAILRRTMLNAKLV